MAVDAQNFAKFLEGVANDLDIPPSKYRDAVSRYTAVGSWLHDGIYSGASGEVNIYPQGSFRLGTVVRPIRGGVEADYDIDLVCELPITKQATAPLSVKRVVGARLRDHATYCDMLDDEGKRCWTLNYAEQDGVGFHLDVLPSVPDRKGLLDCSIAITNRSGSTYTWSPSNPQGYARWFDAKNNAAFARAAPEQKRLIAERSAGVYASIADVPDQLVRTPLQQAIQLLKRHRDIAFNDPTSIGHAPISMIITTLAAHLYQDEGNAYAALTGIISRLVAHTVLLDGKEPDRFTAQLGLIRRTPDGKWRIGNPSNPDENFADRWHEDEHARARAFFGWVSDLRDDFVRIISESDITVRSRLSHVLGSGVVSKHLSVLRTPVVSVQPTRVQIATSPKPWRP